MIEEVDGGKVGIIYYMLVSPSFVQIKAKKKKSSKNSLDDLLIL